MSSESSTAVTGSHRAVVRRGRTINRSAKHNAVLIVLQGYGSAGSHDEEWMGRYRNLMGPLGSSFFPRQSDSGLRTRRSELVALGLVEATETPGVNSAGNPTTNWRAVPGAI